MKIVADPNIAFVQEAFSEFGEVSLVPGRSWTAVQVRDADILLVRSATPVGSELLEGSKVKFVGSATSGVDHIDVEYLKRKGIAFVSAPGSNANAVAEYVVSALLFLVEPGSRSLTTITAGIIGYGHVGSRVVQLLRALGIRCVINDPPLKQATGDGSLVELEEVILADVVSLHVPLTRLGPYPTYRMIDEPVLSQMNSDVIVINTARGGVVDERALIRQLDERPAMRAVVDCWEGEPDINAELLARVSLGTAHIAGYSFEAKVKATQRLYAAACEHFKRPLRWYPPTGPALAAKPSERQEVAGCTGMYSSTAKPSERQEVAGCTGMYSSDLDKLRFLNNEEEADEELIRKAVLSCYDIGRDSAALKRLLSLPAIARAGSFDELRSHYAMRREFNQVELLLPSHRVRLARTLSALGFRVQASE